MPADIAAEVRMGRRLALRHHDSFMRVAQPLHRRPLPRLRFAIPFLFQIKGARRRLDLRRATPLAAPPPP